MRILASKNINTYILVVMDSISKLPEPILHRILNFLPTKDVIRTSLLSKTWRRIQSSYPTVNFIELYYRPKVFQEYMKNTMQSFVSQRLGVQRFKLYMMCSNDLELNLLIDQWINYVASSRADEVDIRITRKSSGEVAPSSNQGPQPQPPPQQPAAGILLASKTLITLCLCGCELEKSGINVCLPRLRNLVMHDIDLDEAFVQNLLLGCPLLEVLKIERCKQLASLQVSSLKCVKRIRVTECCHLVSFQVSAPSLETLYFSGTFDVWEGCRPCEIDLAACETTLKDLTVSTTILTTEWLQAQISKFLALEHLSFFRIPDLETIKISSPKLKHLKLGYCSELGAATEIDASLLQELDWRHNKLPFYSVSTSNLEQATLYFSLGDHDAVWFDALREFYTKTSHLQNLKVVVESKEVCQCRLYYLLLITTLITTLITLSSLPSRTNVFIHIYAGSECYYT